MADYTRTELRRGDTIELQNDLTASEVEALNHSYVAVLHRTGATQTTYERVRADDSGATVPDSAVVLELGEHVDYLVEA